MKFKYEVQTQSNMGTTVLHSAEFEAEDLLDASIWVVEEFDEFIEEDTVNSIKVEKIKTD